MKIHLLVEREEGTSDSCWVIDAVDEYTLDEWNGGYPSGFQAKLDEDAVNRAILIVDIPEGSLEKAWPPPPAVKGEVIS